MSFIDAMLNDPMEWREIRPADDKKIGKSYRIRSAFPAPAGSVAVYVFDDETVVLGPVKYLAVCDVAYIRGEDESAEVFTADRCVLTFSFGRGWPDEPAEADETFLGVAPSEEVGRKWAEDVLAYRAKHAAKKAAP